MNREWMRQCIWLVVLGSVPLLILFWNDLSVALRWLIPTVLVVALVGFIWFDLVHPFAPDDPAHADLEKEIKDHEQAQREVGKRAEIDE